MKVADKHIYSTDREYLVTLREEYISFGFDTTLEEGHLIVHARKKKRKKDKKSDRPKRRS